MYPPQPPQIANEALGHNPMQSHLDPRIAQLLLAQGLGQHGSNPFAQGMNPGGPMIPAKSPQSRGGGHAANQFALQRLQQLKAMGFDGHKLGVSASDPAALWRAVSPILGAIQAANSLGGAQGYHTPQGLNPAVLALVQKILGAGQLSHEPVGHTTPYGAQ